MAKDIQNISIVYKKTQNKYNCLNIENIWNSKYDIINKYLEVVMFFIMGGGNKVERLDYNQTIVCRECGSYGRFEAFVQYSTFTLFFIPILKWDRKYNVRSSCCGSLYEISKSVGKDLESGRIKELKYGDLKPIKVYKDNRVECSNCGKKAEIGAKFCPNCGSEM